MTGFFKTNKNLVPKVDITPNYIFISSQKDLTQHLKDIIRLPYWVLDVETTGKDPHVDKVIMLQIGNRKIQYVIDVRYVDISELKPTLESEAKRKITQFGHFECLMLNGTFGIRMECLRDTFFAEQMLVGCLQRDGFSMEAQALKYLHVELDKEMQTSFIGHTGPFTQRQIQYAAIDCIVPDFVLAEQFKLLERYGMVETWLIECNAIPAFADIEFYGMNLDVPLWEKNIAVAEKKKEESIRIFLKEVSPFAAGDQLDVFNDPVVNPASPAQVLPVLIRAFGEENCKDNDGKLGTGDEVLTSLSLKFNKPALVTSLQEMREADKKVGTGTYGHAYIRHIHSKTGRFHPRINQIGSETGRPAGKKPNMLNIPAESEYREPWRSISGCVMLSDDYGACELRIMASSSGDPVMCKGFNEGLDYHTYTASQFISDDNEFLRIFIPGKEVGKGKWGDFIFDGNGEKIRNSNFGNLVPYEFVTKAQRDVAKTINFGLAYGMGSTKLSNTLGITKEKAREYIKKFNTTFKVLVAWLKGNQEKSILLRACSFQELQKAAAENREPVADLAYAETALGRKRFFIIPKEPSILKVAHNYQRYNVGSKFDKETEEYVPQYEWRCQGFETLKYNPLDPWDKNLPETLRKYYQRMAGIKREGGNSPIQGGNADITKVAMYEIRKWIRATERERNNGEYLAHLTLQVYDELLAECPEWLAPEMAKKMDELMIKAGKLVITQVPVEASCIIANSWTKG